MGVTSDGRPEPAKILDAFVLPMGGRRTQKDAHATLHHMDPTQLFRLSTAPTRRNPCGSQSLAPVCACYAANASAGLPCMVTHGGAPAAVAGRFLLQHVQHYLFLQHPDETLATYVRNN
jgi:hypothetical protein